jgi:hypothetical protein
MATTHLGHNTQPLDTVRRHRIELLETAYKLEKAIGAPVAGPDWRPRFQRRLDALRDAFAVHMRVTEGAEGLYAELLQHAPRLAAGVRKLVRDHEILAHRIDQLCARARDGDPRRLRERTAELLRDLGRHRQRGADLVYEAYHTDIGGEN